MSLRAPIILSRKIILSFFQNVDCKILSFSDTNIKIVMRVFRKITSVWRLLVDQKINECLDKR